MKGGELATLYTLQHGLSGNTEQFGGFQHWHVALRGVFNEASAKLLVHTDAPWCARGNLFACDEAIGKPAVQGGGGQPKHLSCFLNADQFSL